MAFSASKKEGFEGTLSNIQLIDLLQMACLSKVSMNISVEGKDKKGLIQIFNGNIVHAETEGKEGEEAFFEIMAWESGSFKTFAMEKIPPPTIEKNWEFLLIEATRAKDEARSAGEKNTGKQTEEENEKGLQVLIVDDSKLVCKKMAKMLESHTDIQVVGYAHNGREALEKLNDLAPDLVTLDINMPIMGGDSALKHIMIHSPCPVVILSGVDPRNSSTVFEFLGLGAVDYIEKPKNIAALEKESDHLVKRLKIAAKAKVQNFRRVKKLNPSKSSGTKRASFDFIKDELVLIFGETGACAELLKIVPPLPININCCLLLFQKMDETLFEHFATYLNQYSGFQVIGAQNDQTVTLRGGVCALASLPVSVRLIEEKEETRIDFRETSNTLDGLIDRIHGELSAHVFSLKKTTWVFLSGESRIDVNTLVQIKEKDATILAQDPATALYPALPSSCIETGLVDIALSSERLGKKLIRVAQAQLPRKRITARAN